MAMMDKEKVAIKDGDAFYSDCNRSQSMVRSEHWSKIVAA